MMIDFDYLFSKYGVNPHGVLHLGANTGQEAETYKRLGVKEVVWVEAIPSVYDNLKQHLEMVNCEDGAVCVLACVGDEDGKVVKFNLSNNEFQSSSYLKLGHHKVIHPTVNYIGEFESIMHRGDVIFKDFNFEGKWLLNADLQGSELQAFKGMGELLHKFEWVYTEVNMQETYIGCALIEEVDEYLSKFGFVRAETGRWVADTWTDAFYIKK